MIIQSRYRVDLMETIQPTSMHTMMIQGDAEANRILLEVYQGGLPYDLTGSDCVATVIRADAAEVPITGSVSGNAMYIDLPQEAYACDGRIIIIMRNVQGQSDVSLFYGIGVVLIGAAGTVINPGGRIPTLVDLLAELDAMADATAAANAAATKAVRYDTAQSLTDAEKLQARENIGVGTGLVAYDTAQVLTDAQKLQARTNIRAADIASLAPAFLPSKPYNKGDVVHRYGVLYVFTADHPAGAWTGNDVEETDIDALLKNAGTSAAIAPTEASATATMEHIPGTPSEYFILSGTLYRATTPIAVGWTITPGTNCQTVPNGLSSEIVALQSAIRMYSQPKTSSDYTWTLKKNIDNSGTVINANGFALSNTFGVSPGTCIINQCAATGYNSQPQVIWVHEFSQNQDFLQRTELKSGKILAVGNDCHFVQLAFGYPTATGVTITQAIINTYFKAAILDAASDRTYLSALETMIDDAHGYVDYGYPYVLLGSSASHIGVERSGPVIVLNGGGLADAETIKIDGGIARATGEDRSSIIDAWVPTVTLEAGHKYRYSIKWLSGTISGTDVTPTIGMYLANTHLTIGEYKRISNRECERTITGTGAAVSLGVYCQPGVSYTNAKFLLLLEDVTENSLPQSDSDFVGKLREVILKTNQVDFSLSTMDKYTINISGVWVRDDNYKCVFIRVPPNCFSVRMVPKANLYVIYAFLTDPAHEAGQQAAFVPGTDRMRVNAGDVVDTVVPNGTYMIYIYAYSANDGDVLPASMEFYTFGASACSDSTIANVRAMVENQLATKQDAQHNDIPDNRGVRNALRKAAQTAGIQWTPLTDVPANDGDQPTSSFPAGVTVTGLPYSSAKECMKFVGKDVSLRTFMTAVHNPYSLFYTENISGSASASGYGFTYHGVNCACYYGDVCSALNSYVLGIMKQFETAWFAYYARQGVFDAIYDQSADGLKLGDLWWQEGHGKNITGITRDEYGGVVSVEVTEATTAITPGQVRAITQTAEEFNTLMERKAAIIYRYNDMYKNLQYTPSDFVAVENESPETYVYNDDICTFAGDYAAFKCGDPVWLNYTKGSYTGLEIYNGTTLVTTLTLDASSDVHKVNITSYTSAHGKYKARLTGSGIASDYTYWQMIDAQQAVTNNDGILTVTFSSANASPAYVLVSIRNGTNYFRVDLTDADVTNGFVTFDPAAIYKDVHRSIFKPNETVYARVIFNGEYGTALGGWSDTGLYS